MPVRELAEHWPMIAATSAGVSTSAGNRVPCSATTLTELSSWWRSSGPAKRLSVAFVWKPHPIAASWA
jgi:hypothetical protein